MKKKTGIIIMTIMLVIAAVITGCSSKRNDIKKDIQALSKTGLKGYLFEINGVKMSIDAEAEPVIEKLGDPADYFEAPSCAFEGIDKTYTYGSYVITTYQIDGTDYIGSIILKDDMVATREGVSLYMTKADMENAYGNEYEVKEKMFIYSKEGMNLNFIIDNNEITSIEYSTTKI